MPGDALVDAADEARLAAIVLTHQDIAASEGDLGRVLLLVVERTQELTDAAGASLELLDGPSGEFVVRAASGICVDWVGRREPGDVVRTTAPVASATSITAPLLHRDRPIGRLRVVSNGRQVFADADVNTVRLVAGMAADAVRRTTARTSERGLRSAFDDAPIGMALIGLDGAGPRPATLLQANRALCAMVGRDEPALLLEDLLAFVHPEERPALTAMLHGLARGAVPPPPAEHRLVRSDGEVVWASLGTSTVIDDEGRPRYAVLHVEDISRRKQAEARLTELSFHDALTGLPNRPLLLDRLQRSLARARRRRAKVALLFCDLDRFKVINDSLGHDVGDRLLVTMADRLKDRFGAGRAHGTIARLGGDEFVVVCEDVTEEQAIAEARRLQDVLAAPCPVGDSEVVVTASVGIVLSDGFASPFSLLRDADVAMYRAKDRGGGRVELFDEAFAARALDRLRTENGLRRALEQDELRLHYQPIVDLTSGAVRGFEALVRWDDPERGLLSPEQFLDVAEETGLIVPIGAWVLGEACRQMAEWQRRFGTTTPWTVSVNLSARQVARSKLANVVSGALREGGLDPACLCLELTESALIEASTPALGMLRSLKALGVRLAIDDFGTGYSSLAYLRRFPVDVVKVDRSFVAGLGRDGEDDAIVGAVVGLTQRLGLGAVAEGVETEGQADRLRELGCELAQGFLFARPGPPEEVEHLLGAEKATPTLAG